MDVNEKADKQIELMNELENNIFRALDEFEASGRVSRLNEYQYYQFAFKYLLIGHAATAAYLFNIQISNSNSMFSELIAECLLLAFIGLFISLLAAALYFILQVCTHRADIKALSTQNMLRKIALLEKWKSFGFDPMARISGEISEKKSLLKFQEEGQKKIESRLKMFIVFLNVFIFISGGCFLHIVLQGLWLTLGIVL